MSNYSTDSDRHRLNQRLRSQQHAHNVARIKVAADKAMDRESLARVKAVNAEILGGLL